MKRFFRLCFILLICLLFNGCKINYSEYPKISEKSNINYYTLLLASELNDNDNYNVSLLETNLYKEVSIDKDAKDTIINFLSSLEANNFIKLKEELKTSPEYKFFIKANSNKYIINVYNENLISIHPWDGTYNEDFITMNNIPKAYNLYGLCKYILNKN